MNAQNLPMLNGNITNPANGFASTSGVLTNNGFDNLTTNGWIGDMSGNNDNVKWNREVWKLMQQMGFNAAATNNANQVQDFFNKQNAQFQDYFTDKANKFTQQQTHLQAQINSYLQDKANKFTNSQALLQGQMNNYFQDKANAYNYYMDTHKIQNQVKDMIAAGVNPMVAMQSASTGGATPSATAAAGGSAQGQSASVQGGYGANGNTAAGKANSTSVHITGTNGSATFSANSAASIASAVATIAKFIV